MSSLRRMFGNVGKPEATPEKANERLREVEDTLIKRQAFLENKINDETDKARKFGTRNKRAALECLKRRNAYRKQLQATDGILMNLGNMQRSVNESAMNRSILEAMKTANIALKKIHKDLNVDKVHDVMDDISEQQDIAAEIAEAISANHGTSEFDDDELLRELEELEEEDVAGQLLDVSGVALPSVPAGEPIKAASSSKASRVKEEDEELSKLYAWSS